MVAPDEMKNWLILSFLSASLPLAEAVVIFNGIGERGELVLFGNQTIEIDFDGDGHYSRRTNPESILILSFG